MTRAKRIDLGKFQHQLEATVSAEIRAKSFRAVTYKHAEESALTFQQAKTIADSLVAKAKLQVAGAARIVEAAAKELAQRAERGT